MKIGSRFVEADMAITPNTEELEIHASGFFDFLIVSPKFRNAWEVRVFRLDIDFGEEILVHKITIGLVFEGTREIFVEVEALDLGKRDAFCFSFFRDRLVGF